MSCTKDPQKDLLLQNLKVCNILSVKTLVADTIKSRFIQSGSTSGSTPVLTDSGVTAGTYENSTVTVNSQGLVTSAASNTVFSVFEGAAVPIVNLNLITKIFETTYTATNSRGLFVYQANIKSSAGIATDDCAQFTCNINGIDQTLKYLNIPVNFIGSTVNFIWAVTAVTINVPFTVTVTVTGSSGSGAILDILDGNTGIFYQQ